MKTRVAQPSVCASWRRRCGGCQPCPEPKSRRRRRADRGQPHPPPAEPRPSLLIRRASGCNTLIRDLTRREARGEIEGTFPSHQSDDDPAAVCPLKSAKYMWKDRSAKPQWVTVVRNWRSAKSTCIPITAGRRLDIHDMPFHSTKARKNISGPAAYCQGRIGALG